jgi:DNA-binding MarR family transcriptional regulator
MVRSISAITTDKVLDKFQLSSGTYPFLLMLKSNEGISQNQISKELNVDKALSARAIKRLISLGYIKKEENEEDIRSYKLYLTDKARSVIADIIEELNKWIDIITEGLTEQEKSTVIDLLGKIMKNANENKNKAERG